MSLFASMYFSMSAFYLPFPLFVNSLIALMNIILVIGFVGRLCGDLR